MDSPFIDNYECYIIMLSLPTTLNKHKQKQKNKNLNYKTTKHKQEREKVCIILSSYRFS